MLHGDVKQHIGMLALALEPNKMANSTGVSRYHVCMPLESYIVDVDDQSVA
jgi:hypothetical protein